MINKKKKTSKKEREDERKERKQTSLRIKNIKRYPKSATHVVDPVIDFVVSTNCSYKN